LEWRLLIVSLQKIDKIKSDKNKSDTLRKLYCVNKFGEGGKGKGGKGKGGAKGKGQVVIVDHSEDAQVGRHLEPALFNTMTDVFAFQTQQKSTNELASERIMSPNSSSRHLAGHTPTQMANNNSTRHSSSSMSSIESIGSHSGLSANDISSIRSLLCQIELTRLIRVPGITIPTITTTNTTTTTASSKERKDRRSSTSKKRSKASRRRSTAVASPVPAEMDENSNHSSSRWSSSSHSSRNHRLADEERHRKEHRHNHAMEKNHRLSGSTGNLDVVTTHNGSKRSSSSSSSHRGRTSAESTVSTNSTTENGRLGASFYGVLGPDKKSAAESQHKAHKDSLFDEKPSKAEKVKQIKYDYDGGGKEDKTTNSLGYLPHQNNNNNNNNNSSSSKSGSNNIKLENVKMEYDEVKSVPKGGDTFKGQTTGAEKSSSKSSSRRKRSSSTGSSTHKEKKRKKDKGNKSSQSPPPSAQPLTATTTSSTSSKDQTQLSSQPQLQLGTNNYETNNVVGQMPSTNHDRLEVAMAVESVQQVALKAPTEIIKKVYISYFERCEDEPQETR
jgi:AF4/FMR2 family member 2